MREIKFRVYGVINCYYLTIDGWKPEYKMCEVSSLNIKTNKCRVLYKGEKNTNEYDTFDLSKCNLMQFTGLKDKNGKEIYEGDILGGYPHGTICVEWDNNYACFSCYDIEDNKDCGLFSNELDNCKDAWIITGNIYENPELL